MATKVTEALQEVEAGLDPLLLEQEGFEDLDAVDIEADTNTRVSKVRTFYSERLALLQEFIAAAKALLAHGHPVVPVHGFDRKSYQDLLAQKRSIDAALAKVDDTAVASLGQTFSPPRKKS